MNVFEYYINSPSFSNQKSNLEKTLSEKDSNPVSAITYSFYVVTDLVNRLLKDNGITPGSKIVDNIKFLSQDNIIPESVDENLFNLRRIRNKFVAHPSDINGKQVIADPITMSFYMKHLYELLVWYFQKYLGEKITFDNVDDVISNVKEIEVVKESETDNILIFDLPKFYIDSEYFATNSIKKNSVNDLDPKELLEVFKLFFTTSLSITQIEEKVFSTAKTKGVIVYYLINSYMDSGITYSWRKYVNMFGITKTIENIEEKIETLVEDKSSSYRNFVSILKSI